MLDIPYSISQDLCQLRNNKMLKYMKQLSKMNLMLDIPYSISSTL